MSASACVIVDRNEARCGISRLLVELGCDVAVEHIRQGDYALPGDMRIERKSSGDLITSINTGRLIKQLERLSTASKHPVLLIEGDDWQGDLRLPTVMLARLYSDLLDHPKLRLMYSPTLRHTATLIAELADLRSQAEAGPAVELNPTTLTAHSPNELLLAMPDVGPARATKLRKDFTSLAGLASADVEKLRAVLGPTVGPRLRAFFDAPWPERRTDGRSRRRRVPRSW